jgi:hypothetical protein
MKNCLVKFNEFNLSLIRKSLYIYMLEEWYIFFQSEFLVTHEKYGHVCKSQKALVYRN